ncbi:MAG: glycosyl hydrolase-related protein, partial [Candidatus Thorarchaeota archaeon]
KDTPLSKSADLADAFSDEATVISFDKANVPNSLSTPIIQIDNPSVRVSSLRVKNDSLLVTLYNLENAETSTDIKLSNRISSSSEVRIDGSEKEKIRISDNSIRLNFDPREIKMCMFRKD